jgi:hypothetical protein
MRHRDVLAQNAADGTADGTALFVDGMAAAAFQVTGTFVGTVTFEATLDGSTWVSLQVANVADGSVSTTATAPGVFQAAIAGLDKVRARVSVWASGTITVRINAVEAGAGMSFADVDIAGAESVNATLQASDGTDIGDVDVATIAAGETHVGEVGGVSSVVTVVMSMNAAANHANDVLADTQEIASAVRVNGGSGVLHSIVVQDDDDLGGAMDVVILSANTSIGTENSAVSMADNDDVLGTVEIASGDFVDMINSQHATKTNLGIVVEAAGGSTSLYAAVVMRDAGTVTASGLSVRFGFLQD